MKIRKEISTTLAGLLLLVVTSASAAVKTRCATQVHLHTWEPLPRDQISRLVQSAVLSELTRSGRLSVVQGGEELDVRVDARLIEDAAQFSVFVTATPRNLSRVGSVAAVATRSLYRLDKVRIGRRIQEAAREAGKKAHALLAPRLGLLKAKPSRAARAKMPRIDPKVRVPTAWTRSLLAQAKPIFARLRQKRGDLRRLGALRTRAHREATARLAIARCALDARGRRKRTECIDALAQLVKRHPLAQRAVLAILAEPLPSQRGLQSDWREARRKAFRISSTFRGVALQETVQVWLHIFGSDHSASRAFNRSREDYYLLQPIMEYIQRHPEVPNLDLTLARCTRPSPTKVPPHSYCLKVLKSIPGERRLALLYPLLLEPPRYEWRDKGKWGSLLNTVVERGKPLHPFVEKLCMRRVQRGYRWRERVDCIEALGRGGAPSNELVDFLVANFVSSGNRDSIVPRESAEALLDLVKRAPKLCPRLERVLGPFAARGAFPMRWAHQRIPRALAFCRR